MSLHGGGDVATRPIKVCCRYEPPMYRTRIVDASDDDVADTLADLHQLTFFDAAAIPEFDLGA